MGFALVTVSTLTHKGTGEGALVVSHRSAHKPGPRLRKDNQVDALGTGGASGLISAVR
jgi:hypothetical protein